MGRAFEAFKAARDDIDGVYWFDPNGTMRVSVPNNPRTQGSNFSQRRLFQQASTATRAITEVGVDLTTYHAVAAIAQPVRDEKTHQLSGVLATNLSLDE